MGCILSLEDYIVRIVVVARPTIRMGMMPSMIIADFFGRSTEISRPKSRAFAPARLGRSVLDNLCMQLPLLVSIPDGFGRGRGYRRDWRRGRRLREGGGGEARVLAWALAPLGGDGYMIFTGLCWLCLCGG